MSEFHAWLLATRPKTLTASFAPILVGSAIAQLHVETPFPYGIVVVVLICALCIQIATNLINDVEDFKRGADTQARLGPTRVSQAGLLDPFKVKLWAFFFLGLAFLFGIPLIIRGGGFILAGGLASLVCAYLYTGGKYPLAYKGLGELFVLLFFGLFAVIGTSHIITLGVWNWSSFVGGLQVGFFSMALIAINNLRDYCSDREVGKLTLAARFGIRFARVEILVCLLAPFLIGYYWYVSGYYKAFYFPLALLPLALVISLLVLNEPPSKRYNRYLALCSLCQLLFSLCFLYAFL